MKFDVVSLTCRMKSVLITAMFNIGTGGAIPVVTPKGNGVGRELLVSVLLGSLALMKMSLIFLQRR